MARRNQYPFATLDDALRLAKKRLPRTLANMVCQTESLHTGSENTRIFDDVLFRPRAATVFEKRDLKTTVLGTEISMPLLLACPGSGRLFHPEGDRAASAAAARAGTINVVAMGPGHSIEDIAAAASGPLWKQLYMSRGRDGAEETIDRAKRAGYEALVVTVDVPQRPPGSPHGDISRINLSNALRSGPEVIVRPRWLTRFLKDKFTVRFTEHLTENERLGFPAGPPLYLRTGTFGTTLATTWDDFDWISKLWDGPIVVKGILSGEDARRAVDVGAAALIVSNHGAIATLDTFPSTLRMLPEVVAAVNGDCEVLFDSGIRSGAHVVKAVALGARACLTGRPYLWGLAAAGEEGVYRILEIFRGQIDHALAGIGCPAVSALDPSYVEIPSSWPRWTPASTANTA
jgi:isopentenyl diphosphate isomerase/L-lactate dehydrogenase-like FMN-dependent dehydrogenase